MPASHLQPPDQLIAALEREIQGPTAFDELTRGLYSTDASNHQLQPLGVVIPATKSDVQAAVQIAAEHNVPVLARGGATSLAGQTVGQALVLDMSKHFRNMVELDPESQTALVEPGVVCSELNAAAAHHGLMYGPDPASANRATFGGMIGNNATGAHSVRYGMTADHLLELEAVLADGSVTTFRTLNPAQLAAKRRGTGLEGGLYRASERLAQQYRQAIEQDWPRTWRRSSGYSLNYLTGFTPGQPPGWYRPDTPYPPVEPGNLAPLLCGSEGTLAVTTQARVRLVPVPAHTLLVVLTFDSVQLATEYTPALLETAPAAIELLPRTLLERAQRIPAYARRLTFIDEIPEAMLVVEFAGDSAADVRQQAKQIELPGRWLETPAAQADLWDVRKAGLGLLMSVPGDVKPITFIEDVAVPVERLSSYVRTVDEIMARHGTSAEWYAHASAGCLHLRPLINLKTADGVRQMRAIGDEVAEVVFELQGALSGEHGDGLSHTEFNARLFGPRLTQAFHELKRAFDPQDILNPGKILPSARTGAPSLDQDLRYGPSYQTITLDTHFAHRREGSLAAAVEACTGLGVCRKSDGVMCPSYQATLDELHSTRARANALRLAMSGWVSPESLTSEAMYGVFDLCLECKGCKSECPTAVDIARVKAEFLAAYQAEHGLPLRSRLFGEIHQLARLAQPVAPLVNVVSASRPARWLQQALLGIASQRTLPTFVPVSFRRRWRPASGASGQPVVLFVDTYTDYMLPGLGESAVKLLTAAGCEVQVVPGQVCCGRPMISKGMLGRARQLAAKNVEVLGPYAERGIPILGLEPSCISALQDEYLELFPEDARAAAVAAQASLLEAWLMRDDDHGRPIDRLTFRREDAPAVKVHTHCHTKALTGQGDARRALASAGCVADEIDSGCCGMAGSFGYEAEHLEVSLQVGELKLLPEARLAAREGQTVVAHGMSCRAQLKDGASVEALHPIELLAERLS